MNSYTLSVHHYQYSRPYVLIFFHKEKYTEEKFFRHYNTAIAKCLQKLVDVNELGNYMPVETVIEEDNRAFIAEMENIGFSIVNNKYGEICR